jgi:hypothetical protein
MSDSTKTTILDNCLIRLTKDESDPFYTKYTAELNHWNILDVALMIGWVYTTYKNRHIKKYKSYEEMAKLYKSGKM